MSTLQEIQEFYLKRHNTRVIEAKNGYAKLVMSVEENALNIYGIVHGGELFTLADNAGGIAGFSNGHEGLVTLSANINYLNAAKCKECIAIAQEVNSTRKTGVYDVCIYNEEELLLCKATFTYYYKKP
ncbi:MAG: PaaI family thioesterase [Bacillota bacterium]|nr:PaaI family thioesterase [Bacillota bacterium]